MKETMKETIQVLNWDRTVAGRIYAKDTEELLESGNYERLREGVIRCKPKNNNGEQETKENNMTLIEDYKKCLGHPLYEDTEYLLFSLIEGLTRVVDMHNEDRFLESLDIKDLNVVIFRRFVTPFIVAEGVDKTIDLFKEIIIKCEMAPSFRGFMLGIAGSNRFRNLLINMEKRFNLQRRDDNY